MRDRGRPREGRPDAANELLPPGLVARQAAAKLLAAVVDARTPLDGLTDDTHGHPQYRALDGRDRALVRAILRTALRFRGTIAALLAAKLERPLPANAAALNHILHVGAAQILFLDLPDRSAVDLAVEQAKADPRARRWAALVNGVLRALARTKESELSPALARMLDAPSWFAAALRDAWGPERAEAVIASHRVEPGTDFTVTGEPERWAATLGGVVLPTGTVRVSRLPGPVTELPGFAEGAWWVQDAAAALPARLMGDVRELRVADLCAAPGGKTAQLAAAGARVTAVDASASRLKRLRSNLDRLGLDAEVVEADILQWEPAAPFDAVLLDAPCSSTGTVRRHPDVPWTKTEGDVAKLAALQRRLLDRAWRLVRPGGRLVFSNCSLLPAEGEGLWASVLAATPELAAEPIRADELPGIASFVTAAGTLRTTPADWPSPADPVLGGLDGFFAARAVRRG